MHTHGADAAIAAVAERQHGRVARWQLLALGLGRGAIAHRVRCGRLHVVHRGVYAVGHPTPTQRATWMAAVLAAPRGSVLSHRSAAALWGLHSSSAVEVTAPRGRSCRAPITVHRSASAADERTVRDGIPTTTVARTLLDLATVLPRADLEAALHQAEYDRRADALSLDALVARYPRRAGTATLRAFLDDLRDGTDVTKSDLEIAFMGFLDDAGLPRPRRNHVVEGFTCDCVWPAQRVIVELDGRGHDTTRLFESDRLRDRKLVLATWRPIRVTWRHVHRGRRELERDLRELFAQA